MARFEVTYQVRTGIDGSVVNEHTVTVTAADEAAAARAAIEWAHENVARCDERIDPTVHVTDVSETDEEDEDVPAA